MPWLVMLHTFNLFIRYLPLLFANQFFSFSKNRVRVKQYRDTNCSNNNRKKDITYRQCAKTKFTVGTHNTYSLQLRKATCFSFTHKNIQIYIKNTFHLSLSLSHPIFRQIQWDFFSACVSFYFPSLRTARVEKERKGENVNNMWICLCVCVCFFSFLHSHNSSAFHSIAPAMLLYVVSATTEL